MATCGKKVKNPCKLCLQPVTQKTGLQCQGACLSWVHYTCLNYTPGRIKDIKDGIIKVTCPCPDCVTKFPKEYRTDQPFSCNNDMCPANRPPKCPNVDCPSNSSDGPIPANVSKPPKGITVTLDECRKECQKHAGSHSSPVSPGPSSGCVSGCASSGDIAGRGGDVGAFPSLEAVQQMCNTVGQLTTQINELMNRMKQTMQEKGGGRGGGGGGGSCPQQGPRSNCPKPCYCPGNPTK